MPVELQRTQRSVKPFGYISGSNEEYGTFDDQVFITVDMAKREMRIQFLDVFYHSYVPWMTCCLESRAAPRRRVTGEQ